MYMCIVKMQWQSVTNRNPWRSVTKGKPIADAGDDGGGGRGLSSRFLSPKIKVLEDGTRIYNTLGSRYPQRRGSPAGEINQRNCAKRDTETDL